MRNHNREIMNSLQILFLAALAAICSAERKFKTKQLHTNMDKFLFCSTANVLSNIGINCGTRSFSLYQPLTFLELEVHAFFSIKVLNAKLRTVFASSIKLSIFLFDRNWGARSWRWKLHHWRSASWPWRVPLPGNTNRSVFSYPIRLVISLTSIISSFCCTIFFF